MVYIYHYSISNMSKYLIICYYNDNIMCITMNDFGFELGPTGVRSGFIQKRDNANTTHLHLYL